MDLRLVAATFMLLLSCSVSSYRLEKREVQEKDVIGQVQDVAKDYWNQVSNTAQSWLDGIKSLAAYEKARDIFEKTTSAVNVYSGVLSDQAFYWWHGDS